MSTAAWLEHQISLAQVVEKALWERKEASGFPVGTPEADHLTREWYVAHKKVEDLQEQVAFWATPAEERFPPAPSMVPYGSNKKRHVRTRAWYEEVRRRVRARALELAGGDEKLGLCYFGSMQFNVAMKPEAPHVRPDGSRWWQVGRNASHEFYIGFLPDGTFGSAACGDDLTMDDAPEFDLSHWQMLRDDESRYARKYNKTYFRDTARLSVEDGKLRRSYWGDRWSQRAVGPEGVGYIGHH